MGFADRADDAIRNSVSWITNQRWYGDKSRRVTSIDNEAIVPIEIDDLDAVLALVRFAYERGPDSRYFLPLVENVSPDGLDATSQPVDALADMEFQRWFLDGFAEQRRINGEIVWRWKRLSDEFPDASRLDLNNARKISAEQSNTSIVFDDVVIGKVFRKLQEGINPDLEIGAFFAERNRFTHVPMLYGLIEIDENGTQTAVAAIHQFIRNTGDGWSWLLQRLETMESGQIDDLVDEIALLGRRTAGMHVALASDHENPAFAPETFSKHDADSLIKRIVAEMEGSVEALAKLLSASEVEQLHKGIGSLMSNAWSLVDSQKTRVHGDYHLGQTLRTVDSDFCLIDFEGEPSRTISQRREKQSPLKDVAGMLRSLDYAAASMLSRIDDEYRRQMILAWLRDASAAYVAAYRDAMSSASDTLVPRDDDSFRDGLNILIAEKALYEVRYELDNRPDWLSIPLNGIRRLAGISVPGGGAN